MVKVLKRSDEDKITFKAIENINIVMVTEKLSRNTSTSFLRQLTSLSAASNQIDNIIVFSNGPHYL